VKASSPICPDAVKKWTSRSLTSLRNSIAFSIDMDRGQVDGVRLSDPLRLRNCPHPATGLTRKPALIK
jgi:hypothetical protein